MPIPGRFQFDLYILLAFTLTTALAPTSVFVSKQTEFRPSSMAIRDLAWFLRACIGYMIISSLEILVPGERMTFFFSSIGHLFIASVPTWWFLFSIEYAAKDRFARVLRRFLWIGPIIVFLIVATNPYHRLYWSEWRFMEVGPYSIIRSRAYGPLFWVVWLYLQSIVIGGTAAVLNVNFRNAQSVNRQTFIVSVGALIPILINGVFVLRIIPGFHKDFTSISFALAALVLTLGVFYHKLFDLVPIARRVLVEALSDPLIALDENNRIVDANPAARRICYIEDKEIGSFARRNPFLAETLDRLATVEGHAVEASPNGTRWYEVRAEVVRAGSRSLRLLALRDITERRLLVERLSAALSEIRSLEGIIPICARCKKIRDDSGYWQQVESYVSSHTRAQFSHGICPDCRKEVYPDLEEEPEPSAR